MASGNTAPAWHYGCVTYGRSVEIALDGAS